VKEEPNYYAIIPANVRYSENLTGNAKLLYGEITALANQKGYCWASNDYFAKLYNTQSRTIIRWINSLVDNGFITRKIIYKDNSMIVDKRMLSISDPVTKMSRGSDKNVTEPSDKNVTRPSDKNVTDNTTSINTTRVNNTNNKTVNNVDLEKRFNDLWKLYPNKKGKPVALRAYKKAIKDGVTDDEVRSGINNYLTEIKVKRTEQQYIKHGSTWFNQHAWEDDYETSSVVVKGTKRETLPDWARDDYEPSKKKETSPETLAEIKAQMARLQKEAT
jgi:hypothetical protein